MEIIIIILGIVALAYWQNSVTLNLIAGIAALGFGIYWIATEGTDLINIVIGIASGLIGFHQWVRTAVYLFGGNRND